MNAQTASVVREGAAQTDAQSVLEVAGKILADEPGVQVDFLALTDPLLGPARPPTRASRADPDRRPAAWVHLSRRS